MLKTMREIAPVLMWVVIVAFISTIFFSWGMNYSSGQQQDERVVGKVGKKEIGLQYFSKMVSQERDNLIQSSNSQNRDVPQQKLSAIPFNVWERQVSQELHKRVFEKMKLGASADEIYSHLKNNPPEQIRSVPQFQTDSMFDTSKYIAFLNRPESYENPGMIQLEKHASEMLIPMNKLKNLIEVGAVPSMAEVEREFVKDHSKIVFRFVSAYADSFEYDKGRISEDEVKEYYETHKDSFELEEKASLYYVKIPKEPTPEDEEVYKEQLINARKRIIDSVSTFAEEAEILSDDPGSAESGGALGWMQRGRMVPSFEETAFSMKPGELSKPVKTQFGYHLIQVHDRKTLEDSVIQVKASHILKEVVPTVETLDSLIAVADTMQMLADSLGIQKIVEKYPDTDIDSTGYFGKREHIKGIGYVSGASSYAFSKDEERDRYDHFENDKALFILDRKDYVEEGYADIKDVKESIKTKIADSLKIQQAQDSLLFIIEKSNGEIPDTGAVDSRFVSGITDTVTADQFIKNVGANNRVVATAFAVELNSLSDPVVDKNGDPFVVKPLYRDMVDSIPSGTPEMDKIRNELYAKYKKNIYNEWYKSYKEGADIKNNVEEFYSY